MSPAGLRSGLLFSRDGSYGDTGMQSQRLDMTDSVIKKLNEKPRSGLVGGSVLVPWKLHVYVRWMQSLITLFILGFSAYGIAIGSQMEPGLVAMIIIAVLSMYPIIPFFLVPLLDKNFDKLYDARTALALDGFACLFWLSATTALSCYTIFFKATYQDNDKEWEKQRNMWDLTICACCLGFVQFSLFLLTTVIFIHYYYVTLSVRTTELPPASTLQPGASRSSSMSITNASRSVRSARDVRTRNFPSSETINLVGRSDTLPPVATSQHRHRRHSVLDTLQGVSIRTEPPLGPRSRSTDSVLWMAVPWKGVVNGTQAQQIQTIQGHPQLYQEPQHQQHTTPENATVTRQPGVPIPESLAIGNRTQSAALVPWQSNRIVPSNHSRTMSLTLNHATTAAMLENGPGPIQGSNFPPNISGLHQHPVWPGAVSVTPPAQGDTMPVTRPSGAVAELSELTKPAPAFLKQPKTPKTPMAELDCGDSSTALSHVRQESRELDATSPALPPVPPKPTERSPSSSSQKPKPNSRESFELEEALTRQPSIELERSLTIRPALVRKPSMDLAAAMLVKSNRTPPAPPAPTPPSSSLSPPSTTPTRRAKRVHRKPAMGRKPSLDLEALTRQQSRKLEAALAKKPSNELVAAMMRRRSMELEAAMTRDAWM